jgi:hypothetical protein
MRYFVQNPILTFVVFAALAFPNLAIAKTIRHCKSFYELQFLSINPTKLKNGAPGCSNEDFRNNRCENNIKSGPKLQFGHFESRGQCGKLVPNRCRERARGHAQDCMKAHWDTRNTNAGIRPSLCTNSKGVEGYTINDIKKRLEFMACCSHEKSGTAASSWRKVVVSLRGVTTGDKKCPGVLNFSTTYKIDCTAVANIFGKACGGE